MRASGVLERIIKAARERYGHDKALLAALENELETRKAMGIRDETLQALVQKMRGGF